MNKNQAIITLWDIIGVIEMLDKTTEDDELYRERVNFLVQQKEKTGIVKEGAFLILEGEKIGL